MKFYKSIQKDDKNNKISWEREVDIDDSLYSVNEKRLLRDIAKLLGYIAE